MRFIYNHNHSNLRRLVACVLLVLLMGIGLVATAGAEVTAASVSFTEGNLSLGSAAEGSGLNFAFGEHELPVRASMYETVNDKDHILQVEDARYGSGNWHVTVEMTAFSDLANLPDGFDAVIALKDPVLANSNREAGTGGLQAEADVSVTSGMGPVRVLAADDTLPRGVFTATWKTSDVTLQINDENVRKINPSAYEATLTWTLALGPA